MLYKMTRSILVVAAHPDDEWFGIGGTLLKYHRIARYKINILIITDGERGDGRGPDRLKASGDLSKTVFKTYLEPLGIPANHIDANYSEAVSGIDAIIQQIQPELILTHHPRDGHQDHRAVFNVVQSAYRNALQSSMWLFQSPSSIGFTPNNIVCIDDLLSEKVALYEKYFGEEIENRPTLSVDHIKRVGSYWGRRILRDYAEAFVIHRAVVL